jgi:hypothetical protein
MSSYRVVSELKYHGQTIDIPEGARDVSVEPLPQQAAVRVTYLREVHELTPAD